jgi:hypothetical protein
VHLQAVRVVAPGSVRLAREQHGEVDQHGKWRAHRPERRPDRLAVVADRRELAHLSIICSNTAGKQMPEGPIGRGEIS